MKRLEVPLRLLLQAIIQQTGRPSSRWRLFKPSKEANATR